LLGLQILSSLGVKHVEAFGDSLLVVQQVAGMFQYFDGSLNAYLDRCLETIALFDDFTVQHVSIDENIVANDLVPASIRFLIESRKIWFFLKNRIFRFAKLVSLIFGRCAEQQSVLLN
jgi:hypothetical protein